MSNSLTKRHPALQPLSWHHHHALVLAQLLTRQAEPANVLKDKLQLFWINGGRDHFREEEEFLLPEFAKEHSIERPEIQELLIEHIKIRSLISEICDEDKTEKIPVLGEMLRTHIQKEERIVFPLIQSSLTDEQLYLLQSHFSDHIEAHAMDYTFVKPSITPRE